MGMPFPCASPRYNASSRDCLLASDTVQARGRAVHLTHELIQYNRSGLERPANHITHLSETYRLITGLSITKPWYEVLN